jgi:hypothetical protein
VHVFLKSGSQIVNVDRIFEKWHVNLKSGTYFPKRFDNRMSPFILFNDIAPKAVIGSLIVHYQPVILHFPAPYPATAAYPQKKNRGPVDPLLHSTY